MPEHTFATQELSKLLGVLAHPERILIVEELRQGELDVNSIQKLLGVPHSRVSQNLAILRSNRIVVERREGRRVFYRLVHQDLASWLLDGLDFLGRDAELNDQIRSALGRARAHWRSSLSPATDV